MQDTRNKKLLSTLRDGDLVLCVLEGNGTSAKQIVRLIKPRFSPPSAKYNFSWLNYEVEVLYTNVRLHLTQRDQAFTNCFGIREKVLEGMEELVAKREGLWPFHKYLLTDKEFEINK
jgi:hypothetical protein